MATIKRRHAHRDIATFVTAYADQAETENEETEVEALAEATEELAAEVELDIPEDLSTLDAEALTELHARAAAAFDDIYNSGTLTDEDFETLAQLTESIELLQAEIERREEANELRAQKAAELASRIGRGEALESEAVEVEGAEDATEELAAEEAPAAEAVEAAASEELAAEEIEQNATDAEPEAVVASAKPRPRSIRIPARSVRRTAHTAVAKEQTVTEKPTIKDYLVAAGEGLGVPVNTGVTFLEAGEMLDKRLNAFPESAYRQANAAGRQLSERHSLVQIQRPIPDELMIKDGNQAEVNRVLDYATDERRLSSAKGSGSLVAAGGWCAPSEIWYDLGDEVETREGLLSIPEVGINRGGVSFTTGVDFRDLYAQVAAGAFSFTEAQDIAGEYAPNPTPGQPNVEGPKPCFRIECPDFEEYRLDVDGLCITAGILQSKGYPEVQARTIRGALVAHDHIMNGKMIAQMAAGSTPVTLPAGQAGTAAPLLTAIELQVEHYRASRRMARNTTLEAVFPFWVRGAVRSDLSRRLGVDMISVPNARIDAWFTERGVSPQFVYNWQAIDLTAAGSFTSWPTTVSFMLYTAGTWFKGISELITIDTLYDSVLLGNNDFTALFTEEGWFVAKRGQDSRLVTTSICADGATHAGIAIECNGAAAAAAVVPGATAEAPLFTSAVGG